MPQFYPLDHEESYKISTHIFYLLLLTKQIINEHKYERKRTAHIKEVEFIAEINKIAMWKQRIERIC